MENSTMTDRHFQQRNAASKLTTCICSNNSKDNRTLHLKPNQSHDDSWKGVQYLCYTLIYYYTHEEGLSYGLANSFPSRAILAPLFFSVSCIRVDRKWFKLKKQLWTALNQVKPICYWTSDQLSEKQILSNHLMTKWNPDQASSGELPFQHRLFGAFSLPPSVY